MSNESHASELPQYYQKLGFVLLGLSYQTKILSYEATDDVALHLIDKNLAVEITVEKGLAITAKNKKFLKTLRNYLKQYENSEKKDIHLVLFTDKDGVDKKKFSFKLFEKIEEEIISKKSKLKENQDLDKLYVELEEQIFKLSNDEKRTICKNFDVIIKSKEECENEIIEKLNSSGFLQVNCKTLPNLIHSIFCEYFYKGKSSVKILTLTSYLKRHISREFLKQRSIKETDEIDRYYNHNFVEKLDKIEVPNYQIRSAIIHYHSMRIYENNSQIRSWYIKSNMKSEILEKYRQFSLTRPENNAEFYNKFKYENCNFPHAKESLLDNYIYGKVEYLSDEDYIEWEKR